MASFLARNLISKVACIYKKLNAISCNNMQHPTTTHSWDRLGVVPTLLDCSRPMKCHLIRVLHTECNILTNVSQKKTKRMEALHHLWILKHGTNKTEPWLAMMWIKIFQQFSSWWFQPTHLKKDESKLDHFHVHRDEHEQIFEPTTYQ